MKKSIFTVYVPITKGQEQADRLKQICIDNRLKYHDDFKPYDNDYGYFYCWDDKFCNWKTPLSNDTQVTEAEFIELLKEYKK